MKEIYLVMFTIEYEGSNVEAVCASHEAAVRFVDSGFKNAHWPERRTWRRIDEDNWTSGDFQIWISKRTIIE